MSDPIESFKITSRYFRIKPELATALERIELARKKPVAFAVRANVAFYGVPCDDCPAAGNQVSFDGKTFFIRKRNFFVDFLRLKICFEIAQKFILARDFIHIKEKYSSDWWIGRLVRETCELGFVPSAAKLESIRQGKGKKALLRPQT